MTEAEWLACGDPAAMLRFEMRRDVPGAGWGPRKQRLFACACCRAAAGRMADPRCAAAVEVAEREADGLNEADELVLAFQETQEAVDELQGAGAASPAFAAACLANAACEESSELASFAWSYFSELKVGPRRRREAWGAAVARCVWGPLPFRPVAFDPAWRTSTAVQLARQAYGSRDFSAMPILADALQDAGCECHDLLAHCRDPQAPHIRGCWVVDLVLGKQ